MWERRGQLIGRKEGSVRERERICVNKDTNNREVVSLTSLAMLSEAAGADKFAACTSVAMSGRGRSCPLLIEFISS